MIFYEINHPSWGTPMAKEPPPTSPQLRQGGGRAARPAGREFLGEAADHAAKGAGGALGRLGWRLSRWRRVFHLVYFMVYFMENHGK